MFEIASQIVIYIILAAIGGFITGWMFFKLLSRESSESLINSAYDELAIVKSKKNEIEDELISKVDDYNAISSQNSELNKKLYALEMDYNKLLKDNSNIKSIEQNNIELQKQIKSSQTTIDDQNSTIEKLKKAENIDINATNNSDELVVLNEKNNKLIMKLAAFEEDNLSLKQALKNLKEVIKNRDSSHDMSTLSAIKTQLDQLKSDIKVLMQSNMTSTPDIKELKQDQVWNFKLDEDYISNLLKK
jgi:chromosome segregation ATPase